MAIASKGKWLYVLAAALVALLAGLLALYWVATRSSYAFRIRNKVNQVADRFVPPVAPEVSPALPPVPANITPKEFIYKDGLTDGWSDYGWADHEIKGPGPAKVRFSKLAGWIIYGGKRSGDFGAVTFKMKAPPSFGDFLEVSLQVDGLSGFEKVQLGKRYRFDAGDGWHRVVVPMYELNPHGLTFDRLVLRARSQVGDEWVLLDDIALSEPLPGGRPVLKYPTDDASAVVRCNEGTHPISPRIYGLAETRADEGLRPGAFRLGGNGMSRFNWKLGNAWNTADDWFYQNVKLDWTWREVIERAHQRGVPLTIAVPMLGWVAKDTTSFSFPVSKFGKQEKTDSWRKDSGNGHTPDGKPIPPGPPTMTSIPAPPEFVAEWVSTIRAEDEKMRRRRSRSYILDNEPALWNSTHRDVHPEPVTYDELLDKTLRYGTAVRKADPDAEIVGFAEWGWSNYFWSAKDAAISFDQRPDRRAHGDVPLLDWYLKKLREHEQRTGIKIIDVVDLHFYPQGKNITFPGGDGDIDRETSERRIRSTRALWDPNYLDESWISDRIMLLPRLKKIIAENYPGLGISVGEWNFGAEGHISGAVALAEALGRFAEAGITSAYYWTTPKKNTPAFHGFASFRNYDGKGGRFLDRYVPSTSPEPISLFASKDASGKKMVLIAIHRGYDRAKRLKVDMSSCGAVRAHKSFVYAGYPQGFDPPTHRGAKVEEVLPPMSITVFEIDLGAKVSEAPREPSASSKVGDTQASPTTPKPAPKAGPKGQSQ